MLTASWEDRDHTLWIELNGEMDLDESIKIRDEFNDRIEKGDGDVVVVDGDRRATERRVP